MAPTSQAQVPLSPLAAGLRLPYRYTDASWPIAPDSVSRLAPLGARGSGGQGAGLSAACHDFCTGDEEQQEKGLRVVGTGAHHGNAGITDQHRAASV